jgi:hypothetical protein
MVLKVVSGISFASSYSRRRLRCIGRCLGSNSFSRSSRLLAASAFSTAAAAKMFGR